MQADADPNRSSVTERGTLQPPLLQPRVSRGSVPVVNHAAVTGTQIAGLITECTGVQEADSTPI